jgi:hypothetical protein
VWAPVHIALSPQGDELSPRGSWGICVLALPEGLTDQTGRFPVVSSKGNKYIMILYDYDSNAILAQPIKNQTAPELLKAFQVMEQEVMATGLKLKLMKLDNEASKLLKTYLHQQDITIQLVPPYSHIRN